MKYLISIIYNNLFLISAIGVLLFFVWFSETDSLWAVFLTAFSIFGSQKLDDYSETKITGKKFLVKFLLAFGGFIVGNVLVYFGVSIYLDFILQ